MSGRSIRSEKQQAHFEQADKQYKEDLENAKAFLRKSSSGSKPRYNNPHLIAYKLAQYIVTCQQNDKPLTEAGLRVALSIDRKQYKAYLNGDRDYIYTAQMEAVQSEAEIQLQIDKYKQIENIQALYHYLLGDEVLDDSNIIENKALAMSTPLQKARQLISLDREERLATSGKVSDIYTMKAREGEDWQETAQRTEHIIQIGSNNALEALAQLGYTKSNDNR